MAIDKTKMLVDIQAETGESQKNIKDLNKELKNLSNSGKDLQETSKKTTDAISREQKRYEEIAKTLNKYSSNVNSNINYSKSFNDSTVKSANELNKLSVSLDDTSKCAKNFNESIKVLGNESTRTLTNFSKAVGVSTNSVENFVSVYEKFLDIIYKIIDIFTNLLQIIDLLSDREKIEGFLKILKIMSLIAKIKGFDRIAAGIDLFGDKVISVTAQIEYFKEQIESSLNRSIFYVNALEFAFTSLQIAIGLALTTLSGMVFSGIIGGLIRAASVTGLWSEQIFRLIPTLYNLKIITLDLQRTLFKSFISISKLPEFIGKQFNKLETIFKRFNQASTVGAKRINLFQRAILELDYAFERIGIRSSNLALRWNSLINTASLFVRNGINLLIDSFKNLSNAIVKSNDSFYSYQIFMKSSPAFVLKLRNSFYNLQKTIGELIDKNFTKFIDVTSSFRSKFFDPIIKMSINLSNTLVKTFKESFESLNNRLEKSGHSLKLYGQFIKEFAIGFKDGFVEPLFQGKLTIQRLIPVLNQTGKTLTSLAETLAKLFHPSIVTATKAGTLLGPVVASLGVAALQSENAFVKLAGAISLIVAASFITLGTIITLLLDKIGRLIGAIGDSLINAISKYEEKAIKAQATTKLFQFTIEGFSRVLGENLVGNVELWNKTALEMAKTTVYATNEIRKSIKLLVAEGSSLHLSVSQMSDTLKRAGDIAAITGKELTDVVQRLLSGLQGQSQAVLALGINLSEHALLHSDLTDAMGSTYQQADELGKIQIRLGEIFKQTEPVLGAATAATNTIQGANIQYEKSILDIQEALGAQSSATVAYTNILTKMSKVFLSLPGPIIDIIAIFADLSGVILKIVGVFLEYFLLVSSLAIILKVVNNILAGQGLIMAGLNKAFSFLASKLVIYDASVKNAIISNTSLNAVMFNSVVILKSTFIASLIELTRTIMKVIIPMKALTASILANPLFIKGSAIAIGLYIIITAIQEFSDEIEYIINLIPNWVKVIFALLAAVKLYNSIVHIAIIRTVFFKKEIISLSILAHITALRMFAVANSFTLFIGAVKVLSVRLMMTLKPALLAILTTIKAITVALFTNPLFIGAALIVGSIILVSKAINELSEEWEKLTKTSEQNSKSISNTIETLGFFQLSWLALKDTIYGVYIAIKEFIKFGLIGLIGNIKFLSIAWLKLKSYFQSGEEFEKTKNKINETRKEIQLLRGMATKSLGAMTDAITGTNLALADTIDKTKKLTDNFKLMQERESLAESLKIEILGDEFDKALHSFEKTLPAYQKGYEKLKQKIYLTGQELRDFKKAEEEHAKSFLNLQKLREDSIAIIAEQQRNIHIESLRNSGQLVEATKLENKINLESIDKRIAGLKKIDGLTKEQINTIEKTREAIIKAGNAAIKSAKFDEAKKKYGDLINEYKDLIKKTNDLEKANEVAGKGQLEAIEAGRKAQIKEIDLLEQRLKLMGQLEGKEADLARARGAIEVGATKQQQAAKVDMSGQVGQVGSGLAGMFSDLGETMGGAMGGALSSVSSSIMSMLSSTASSIIGLILKLPSIVDAVAGLINEITDWPEKLFKAVKGLHSAVERFISDFIPNFVTYLTDGIMEAVDHLAEGLPNAIDSLLEKLPLAFERLIDKMPEMAEKFAISLVKMDYGVITIKIFTAIIRMIPKIIVAFIAQLPNIIKAFAEGLKNALLGLGSYIFGDDVIENVSNGFKKLADQITSKTSQLFAVGELENIKAREKQADNIALSFENGARKAVNILEKWWHELEAAWHKVWNKIIEAWSHLWKKLEEIWNAGAQVFRDVWTIFEDLMANVMVLFRKVFEEGGKLWNTAVEFLRTTFESVINLFKSVFETGAKLLNGVWDILETAWSNSFGKLSTSGLQTTLKDLGNNITEGLKESLSQSITVFTDIGKEIWKPISSGFDTLKKNISELSISNLSEKMFKVDYKGQGTVEEFLSKIGKKVDIPWANFAGGGLIPGKALVNGDSTINDRILALLSPGEAVIPRSAMSDPMVSSLVQAILDKKLKVPQFAYGGGSISIGGDGGTLGKVARGDLSGAAKDIGGGISEGGKKIIDTIAGPAIDKMWDQVKSVVFEKMFWNMLEGNKFQHGGLVTGLGGVVEPGEFVLSKPSVQNLGVDFLSGLNGGKSGKSNVKQDFTFNIKIESKEKIDENFIKNRLMPTIKNQLRRDSIDGKRLIEATGIG